MTPSASTSHMRLILRLSVGDLPVGAQDQRVGLDTDVAQRRHRVLGRLGLQLARRREVGHQRDVQEEAVVPADVVADLADRLQERQRLDVADRAAHLGDHDVGRARRRPGPHREDAVLDLVGDVRDDLDGVAEVLPAPLLGDHRRVDLAGGDVGPAVQVAVEEPLVVADVEVGLGAVLGDEHLAVLERVHGARIDVQVRVELLHGDPEAAAVSSCPRLEAVRPLPSEEATPPVTNRCRVARGCTGFQPTGAPAAAPPRGGRHERVSAHVAGALSRRGSRASSFPSTTNQGVP